jgi:hypothetical protein
VLRLYGVPSAPHGIAPADLGEISRAQAQGTRGDDFAVRRSVPKGSPLRIRIRFCSEESGFDQRVFLLA